MKRIVAFLVCVVVCSACTQKKDIIVTVENPTTLSRTNELIELPLDVATSILESENSLFVIKNSIGEEVAYQITYDKKLLFPVTVAPDGKAAYYIEPGIPSDFDVITIGKQYPRRVDDIAWENDKIAFRTYGPALQASGERAFGYDVWAKRVAHPVVSARYDKELNESISYHVDQGDGLDYYSVGPTLGAGASALLDEKGAIVYPWAYKEYEILDNGPLRFTVRLIYNPLSVDGNDHIVETRLLSLDAGTQLNRVEIRFDGLNKSTPVATGIVLHDNAEQFRANREQGYIAYADPADPVNGQLFVGAYLPNRAKLTEAKPLFFSEEEQKERKAFGHLLAISSYEPGDAYTYYFGAGWSKWGFTSANDWFDYMERFVETQQQPLKINYRVNK